MIRKIFTALALCILVSFAMADNEETKAKINDIKKDRAYLYGEATAATAEDARLIAEQQLINEINKYANETTRLEGAENILINNKQTIWEEYSLPRGNMFRSFLYVKKIDLLANNGEEPVVIKRENLVETTTPVNDNIEVVTINPVETTTVATIPVDAGNYPEAVTMIARCTTFTEASSALKNLKSAGKVSEYLRYSKLERPEDYYLFIYNVTSHEFVAVLTPGTSRKNVTTGESDDVKNYEGCGAMGFKLNNQN